MNNVRRSPMLLTVAMLLCLVLTGCSSVVDDDEAMERVQVGDRVPSFTVSIVSMLDYGRQAGLFSTEELTGETVIVLFNTACEDCRRELPRLNEYYMAHKYDVGFQMVAISREEGEESVRAFWETNNLQIPYSAQTDRRVYNLFATTTIPRVYFCNAQGIVTRMYVEKLPAGL